MDTYKQRTLRTVSEVADIETRLGPARRFVDPVFQHSWRHYVCVLVKAGSVKFVAGAQRFIIDARASNQHCSNPFGDFCLQEKVFSMLFQESLEDARNWFGGFRRCQERVSQDAHSQMAASALALPAVLASEVGYTGKVVDKQRLVPDSLIYPVLAAFPTGFSWAMFFCQNVTDHCMLAGGADSPLSVCLDHSAAPRCLVANFLAGSLARLIAWLQRAGLDVHDMSRASGCVDVLGYELSPATACCSVTTKG